MPENFYDLLGVDEDATSDELKRAYRQRAREYHPDVNADDRAGTQFKTVRRAYDVLRDETERSAYDRLGHETYVRKRMKGLPSSPTANASSSDPTTTNSSSRSASNSQSTAHAPSGSERSTRRQSATRSTQGAGATRTARSSQATGRQYRPQESSTPSGRRTRLRNRWVAVFLALGVYVAGFAQFALASGTALDSFFARLAADPAAALTAEWGLGAPTTFVQSLSTDPSPALLFPVGAVLLPAALAATVVKFGRGTAWLYLLGALGPLGGVVAGPLLPSAAGVDLALFVALPVVAALVFLGDVGRYLVATR